MIGLDIIKKSVWRGEIHSVFYRIPYFVGMIQFFPDFIVGHSSIPFDCQQSFGCLFFGPITAMRGSIVLGNTHKSVRLSESWMGFPLFNLVGKSWAWATLWYIYLYILIYSLGRNESEKDTNRHHTHIHVHKRMLTAISSQKNTESKRGIERERESEITLSTHNSCVMCNVMIDPFKLNNHYMWYSSLNSKKTKTDRNSVT